VTHQAPSTATNTRLVRPDGSLTGRFTSRSTWALIGALIAHVPSAIRALQAAGFRPVYSTPQGTYLVRALRSR
jgi:hypothetical protein